MKIRSRLALQFSIIVATILFLFSGGVYYFSSAFRKSDFLNRIELRAQSNARLLLEVREIDKGMLRIIEKNTLSTLYELQVLILDSTSRLKYITTEEDSVYIEQLKDFIPLLNHRKNFSIDKNEGIGFKFRSSKNENYYVFAWAIDKIGLEQLKHLRFILITGFVIGIIIIAFAGSAYARRSLQPISNVIDQVQKITASNLNLRVNEGNGHDEIAQLAIKFNQMLQRLEDAFRMQRNFVSNASHELRTPLTAITGQIEVALMSTREKDEYERILYSLLEDIKSLNAMSNGLLNLAQSSIDPSMLKLNPVRVDEILYESQSAIQRRNSEYIIHFDFSQMPEDDELLTIEGNVNLLQVAFNNLIENACKFSDDKKATVKIFSSENNIVIEVIDSGIGIPENEMEKIFEPFYRARNSKNLFGHGIGLSLSKKIIEIHQGVLNIESKENMGTVVTVKFPVKS